MKRTKRYNLNFKRKSLAMISLSLLLAFPFSLKAEFKVSASVDKQIVTIDDSVILTVAIESNNTINPPLLPKIKNFNIYSSGQKQNMTFINGRISRSKIFIYTLTPITEGKTRIPQILVFDGNIKKLTKPIDIEVVKPGSRAARQKTNSSSERAQLNRNEENKPIFLTAKVDKKSAYINEQVTLTVRFYNAIQLLRNPQYTAPKLEGFIAEDLPPVRTGRINLKGTIYSYNEIKTALFGMKDGYGAVNQAVINAMIQTRRAGGNAFDNNLLQHFFSGLSGGEEKEVRSPKIKVKLRALPKNGKPVSFNGAVGNYKISAAVDRKNPKEGEALNLSLTIEGTGNLKTITMPALPEMSNFKVYDTMTDISLNKANDIVRGKKVFTTIIMPRKRGKYEIKPIKFSFFNPTTKKYREIKTPPIKMKILANGNIMAGASDYQGNMAESGKRIKPISQDIHYVMDNAETPFTVKLAKKISSAFQINYIFLFLLAAGFLFSAVNASRLKNPDLMRSKTAYKKSMNEADNARKLSEKENHSKAVSTLYNSLNSYLSSKLKSNVASLRIKRIIETIKAAKPSVSEQALEKLKKLSNEMEMLHFAPTSINKAKVAILIDNYKKTLKTLEREFKK